MKKSQKIKIINFKEGLISYSILIILILCSLAISIYSLFLFIESKNNEYSLLGIIASSIICLLAGSIQITILLKSKSDKRLNDRKITIEKAFHYSNMLNKYNYLIREMLKINENLFNSYEELLYFFQNNDFYINLITTLFRTIIVILISSVSRVAVSPFPNNRNHPTEAPSFNIWIMFC